MLVRLLGAGLLAAAALRLVVWESYPNLFGGEMLPLWLRAPAYVVTLVAGLGFARWLHRRDGATRLFWGLLLGAYLLGGWWVSFEATLLIDGAHNGRLSGNEGLLLAGVWGLYGLALALAERWFEHIYFRHAARAAVASGLILLALGAMLSNARWAEPGYRAFGYLATVGAAWVVEALFARKGSDGDVQGLVSLTATLVGALATAFESRLWLDGIFTFKTGMVQSAAHVAWETSTRAYATAGAWGVWALGAGLAGVWLRSSRTRLLAGGLSGVALALGLAAVLKQGAAWPLQAGALLVVAGGAAAVASLARRAPGERDPLEAPVFRWLPWAGTGLVLVWGIAKFM